METNEKILIIEDDENIVAFMSSALKREGYQVIWANAGRPGIAMALDQQPDCILLDLGLGDMDGKKVLETLHEVRHFPVIVISARSDEKEKVNLLDSGADDYITKPFGTKELTARIRTALRHYQPLKPALKVYSINGLTIDLDTHQVSVDGQPIHCTPIEFKILLYLARNTGKVVTLEQIAQAVWEVYLDDLQVVRVNVANIRRKIEKNPAQPRYIQTEVGVGYRLVNKED